MAIPIIHQTSDNNTMHAKPDLRVRIEVEITLPAR